MGDGAHPGSHNPSRQHSADNNHTMGLQQVGFIRASLRANKLKPTQLWGGGRRCVYLLPARGSCSAPGLEAQ